MLAELRAEIVALGDTRIDRNTLGSMIYLQKVLKESKLPPSSLNIKLTSIALRLYPSVPVNTRTAK